MCDTLVALGDSTTDGSILFAKNSDREPNEAHEVVLVESASHSAGEAVKCTYLTIPQIKYTYAVLLSKPYWIWGAEMGANEHGVVIGNEALFTRVPMEKEPGLIGMDLLRLGLERGASAREALDTITTLLEIYGQGGNCGHTHPLYYHNSFLIADPTEAWVLETAGRQWAAERVEGIRSISNAITIGSDWECISQDLVSYAIKRGWCKKEEEFHFSRCYSDLIYTRFSDARARQCRTTDLLRPKAANNQLDVQSFMDILRDHGEDNKPDILLRQSLFGCDVCMHAGFGPVRVSQSTGSMVSHLTPERQTHWVTGTSAPCTSIFKPAWIDSGLGETGPAPNGIFDEKSLWWRHEILHRAVIKDFRSRMALFSSERDQLENRFILEAEAVKHAPVFQRAAFTEECFRLGAEALDRWTEAVKLAPLTAKNKYLFDTAWRSFSRQAKLSI
jgi:secernin